ncbi:MAG: hypothetical protein AB8F74_20040, partial [Saprospiraceae bacterium]
MDNKDFDKIFSEKLKETQEFEYMDSDWENVAGRIQPPEEEERRFSKWFWLLGLGFLIMTGTSLYLASSLNSTNKHLVELKEAVSNQGTKTVVVPDTVFEKVTITKIDTIYKTKVVEPVAIRKSIVGNDKNEKVKTPKSTIQSYPSSTNTTNSFTRSEQNNTSSAQTESPASSVLNNDNFLNKATKTNLTEQQSSQTVIDQNLSDDQTEGVFTLDPLQLKELSSSNFSNKDSLASLFEFQKPFVPAISQTKKLSWKNLSVGVTGGVFMPKHSFFQKSNLEDNLTFAGADQESVGDLDPNCQYGFDVGLLLQYQLGKRVSMTGALHYQQID